MQQVLFPPWEPASFMQADRKLLITFLSIYIYSLYVYVSVYVLGQ